MDQEALFKAVDEGRADKVFFADATDGQPSCEVVGKDAQDHGEGVRQVGRWFIPASNEPSGCLQTFGDCREGQIPRCSAALQV